MNRKNLVKNSNEITRVEDNVNTVKYLIDAFPQVDKEYLSRISHYSSENVSDLVIKFSNMSSCQIENYIKTLTDFDYDSEEDRNDSDEHEIGSDEDESLLKLEKESDENCLILGKTFLQIAHDKFQKQCGTETIDITLMPFELTNMSWKPDDELMFLLYRGFLEHIGVLCSSKELKKRTVRSQSFVSPDDFPTLSKHSQLNHILVTSTPENKERMFRPGGTYGNNWSFNMEIATLKKLYPSYSESHIKEIYKRNNMEFEATKKELNNSFRHPKLSNTAVSKKAQESLESLNIKLNGYKIKKQKYIDCINTCQNKKYTKDFYAGKLKECNKMIEWYQNAVCSLNIESNISEYGLEQLDLHGLQCSSAKETLIKRLSRLKLANSRPNIDRKYKTLLVIYGRGNHSHHKIARLRPTIRGLLKRNNILFKIVDEGSIKIPLSQYMDLENIKF